MRTHDYERYLCTLFAPAPVRPDLWAVLALGYELLRIPAMTSEEMAGLVRLKWWQEQCHAVAENSSEVRYDHPVIASLQPLIYSGRIPISLCDDVCGSIAEHLSNRMDNNHIRHSLSFLYQMLAYAAHAEKEKDIFIDIGITHGLIALIRTFGLKDKQFDRIEFYIREMDDRLRKPIAPNHRFSRKLHKLSLLWHQRILQAQQQSNVALLHHIPLLPLRLVR